MRTLTFALLACAALAQDEQEPLPVRMLVPGFVVRELPVKLTNLNNIEYAADGRLFASGYDGRLHELRDTDGDGLEDQVRTFWEKPSDDYPLGMVVRQEGLYVLRRHALLLHLDRDGEGVTEKSEVAATGWRDPEVDKNPLYTHRRVDDALGLALDRDGNIYITLGDANYANAYQRDKEGTPHYDGKKRRGCVLKISPDGKRQEIVATGVRFIVSMQINRHGDLFGTDQEGATWLPNGNPFDELLHLQPGRHYGFPPRHPKLLPDVIDEPSVFDYAPQHQSTCGFRFNEERPGRAAFGPAFWEGDAIVTGESRGKLWRTKVVKTAAGYVARNQLIACLGMLPIDCAVSPRGDLVVACHSGAPDWGSGPSGIGKLFKISRAVEAEPLPVLTWAASPTETIVEFDQPLDPVRWKGLAKSARVEGGRFVSAGDRFEAFRPGYQVVKDQMKAPRLSLEVVSAALGADGRSILLRTPPRTESLQYALALPRIDLAFDLSGVEAEWKGSGEGWTGWLPHLDLAASRGFAAGSAEHDRLWMLLEKPGTLRLRAKLDLLHVLQPAVQPGSKLDFEYPPEKVTVVLRASGPLEVKTSADAAVERISDREVRLTTTPRNAEGLLLDVTLNTGGAAPSLDLSWHTAEDPRPRALSPRRLLLPWARPAGDEPPAPSVRIIPELAGGDWQAGRTLFFGERAACHKCHPIRGEGGRIAPDLTNLIHRDYESVLKDVTQPSAAINPDYIGYTVRLKNGDVLSGIVAGDTAEALTLGTTSGEPVVVPKTRIESMAVSSVSVMPEGILKALSPQELRDLMTYLLMPPPSR